MSFGQSVLEGLLYMGTGKNSGEIKRDRAITDTQEKQARALGRQAEVDTNLAGLEGISRDSRLRTETARSDYERSRIGKKSGLLDLETEESESAMKTNLKNYAAQQAKLDTEIRLAERQEEAKKLQLENEIIQGKIQNQMGQEAADMYNLDKETRNAKLEILKQADPVRAETLKEVYGRMDENNFFSKISKIHEYILPVNTIKNIYYKFLEASEDPADAQKVTEYYLEQKLGKRKKKLIDSLGKE